MAHPVPWAIDRRDGMQLASNGTSLLILRDEGKLFLKRAIKGVGLGSCAAERVLPQLNQLAGELLQQPSMPAQQIAHRLQALAGLAHVPEPVHVEWAVAELDGVKVYCNGPEVLVTKQDMTP